MRADKRTYHYIYKITRDDGKYYIGMHSTDKLEDGYFGSGKLITRSIKKYGLNRHKKDILEFLPSRIDLKERERQLVNEEIVADPMCMNLQLGGGGGSHGKESEIWKRPGFKERVSPLQSAGNKRRWEDPNYRARIVAFNKDKWKDTEYRNKMLSILATSFKGKKHSEETKAKMKATKAERNFGQGEKNSQFGTCWVTNGVKPIKIKKEQLDEYLQMGYSRGRK